MNVNSGGPHLLLFERNQQLTALLTSELQLAGYECHAARTAVEVFDAIARYPIRLVLVNLAQAAAGRREFWVALDAQRRGRGVQVFTFRCMNLAGYGPDDPDERGRSVMADMEVDGMLGVMNLVEAVRVRIPGFTTGSHPRIPATPVAARQTGTRDMASTGAVESKDVRQALPRIPTPDTINRSATAQVEALSSATITGQAQGTAPTITAPLPMQMNNSSAVPSSPPVPSPALQHSQPSAPDSSRPRNGVSPSSLSGPSTVMPSTPPLPVEPGNAPSGLTDKIRAVIYPSNRNFSQAATGQETSGELAWGTDTPLLAEPQGNGQNLQNRSSAPSSLESGLEQLSRLVREHPHDTSGGYTATAQEKEVQQEQHVQPSTIQGPLSEASSSGDRQMQRVPPAGQATADASSLSEMSLRASPIQDIAIERGVSGPASGGTDRQSISQEDTSSIEIVSFNSTVPPSTPALPPTQAPVPAPTSELASLSMLPPMRQPPSVSMPIVTENEEVVGAPLVHAQKDQLSSSFTGDKANNGVAPSPAASGETSVVPSESASRSAPSVSMNRSEEHANTRSLVEQVVASTASPGGMQGVIRRNESGTTASTDETLLNIVQSFPPIPSPSPSTQQAQPPVLTGRATRSLGNVLLEGHLVPQHRLEVAQHIQRMLRGVDMNYQLGEILLMFKLLTPDQLLAASLVSYGLISTMQISALGRIRQELHSIGLEYDLESLLVLFRILTPEQLREVRASWSA